MLDLVFADATTAAEIQTLLDEIGGEIVAGPSALGRYSVRLTTPPVDDARFGELLAKLAADRRVRLAARSFAEGEP